MTSLQDWATDLHFGNYEIPGLGEVHMGFLEGLGFGTRKDIETLNQARDNMLANMRLRANGAHGADGGLLQISGLPNKHRKVLAYDEISKKIRPILGANPRARLYVTGHSLGGALATLFTAVRLYVHNDADESLGAVFTFGQPRVGNSKFARYMEQILCPRHCQGHEKKYFRVVFGSDIVPRVPCWLTHSWPCYFYPSINQCEVREFA